MPGKRKRARVARDFYETPAWCTDLLIDKLPEAHIICDPACGRGAILDRFERTGAHVTGSDIDGRRVSDCRRRFGHDEFVRMDATVDAWLDAEIYVFNPPFVIAAAMIQHGLHRLQCTRRATMAVLLRLSFEEPCIERATKVDRGKLLASRPYDRYVLPERPRFRADTKGTDSTTCAWFVWGPGRAGRTHFLPPRPEEP